MCVYKINVYIHFITVGFFSPLNIMVNEGDTVNITVGLMSEKLCDFVEVMINFTTNNSDTTGKCMIIILLYSRFD